VKVARLSAVTVVKVSTPGGGDRFALKDPRRPAGATPTGVTFS
jgi:hypothetical protein